jgi:hypothetical protein
LAIITIFLYANYVIAAGAVLCADCAVTAVKGFADACRKGEEGVAKDVVCHKDKEGKQRRKELIISLVRVELRQL